MSTVPAATPPAESGDDERPIYLISYPKIVMLYPTFFAALLAGIVGQVMPADSPVNDSVGWAFLWLFALNIVVLAFDFPRTTSLTLFFLIMAAVLGIVLASTYDPNLLPMVNRIISHIRPHANPTFYYMYASILGVIYIFVFTITVRFDYWEVRPNELLHHHGFLSSLERFSAPHLRITKEIDDIFEYLLLGSGRLVLHPSNEPRAFVLDNVPFITAKERRITKMLSALQVKVRDERSSAS
jgi:hypothetical protein